MAVLDVLQDDKVTNLDPIAVILDVSLDAFDVVTLDFVDDVLLAVLYLMEDVIVVLVDAPPLSCLVLTQV